MPEDRPTVLVAEDHPDSLEALTALLQAYGYSVVQAQDGVEAVEKAGRIRPDLILMDIMMPRMDGFEATRALRERPDFSTVPIVALTAMADAREAALLAGCSDFLSKPIDVQALLRTIRRWIARSHDSG